MADEEQKAASELITLAGGVEMEVTFQNNGAGEKVKVRQIPISKMQEFILAMGDESHSIELYCDKPKGWADTLSVESANAVADKGQEINVPFLQAWWKRQAKWRNMQSALMDADADKKPANPSPSANSPRQSPTVTT